MIARDPDWSATVFVGPPLAASLPSIRTPPIRSPVAVKPPPLGSGNDRLGDDKLVLQLAPLSSL